MPKGLSKLFAGLIILMVGTMGVWAQTPAE
jgi:hypothetical protein